MVDSQMTHKTVLLKPILVKFHWFYESQSFPHSVKTTGVDHIAVLVESNDQEIICQGSSWTDTSANFQLLIECVILLNSVRLVQFWAGLRANRASDLLQGLCRWAFWEQWWGQFSNFKNGCRMIFFKRLLVLFQLSVNKKEVQWFSLWTEK